MKILYVTTIGGTMDFFKSYIKHLIDTGNIVNIATNEDDSKVSNFYRSLGCIIYQIDMSRSPLRSGNIIAIKQIKEIVTEEKYDIVHCHTPIAAMCTRFACRKARMHGTKVFYTAHGFHFYKGAPKINWLLFFPMEKICSYFTDILITINQEDYLFAKKHLNAQYIKYVPGVGIDLEKFGKYNPCLKRKELDIPDDAIVYLSVGELNRNKNHETVIRAISKLENNSYYLIAGQGKLHEHLQGLIDELELNQRVKLLGYRRDIPELLCAADVFVFPSYREGLPVSVMEAMASQLPIVCSNIRGNIDLVDEKGGILFNPQSVDECVTALKKIINEEGTYLGQYNMCKVEKYGVKSINSILCKIYMESEKN